MEEVPGDLPGYPSDLWPERTFSTQAAYRHFRQVKKLMYSIKTILVYVSRIFIENQLAAWSNCQIAKSAARFHFSNAITININGDTLIESNYLFLFLLSISNFNKKKYINITQYSLVRSLQYTRDCVNWRSVTDSILLYTPQNKVNYHNKPKYIYF